MFSIVIPLYNKELSIQNTLQSVLNQSYQNFEIVVINDGSTDRSAELVSKINDPRIRLIHQENRGVSAARNRGINEAKHDWIAFLDGDDLWKENHLKEIKIMMDLYPNKMVYVTSFELSDGSKVFRHIRKYKISKVENYFKESLKERIICTGIIAVHKKCFDVIGGFNENLNRGEDWDLWNRLARKFEIIKNTSPTLIYRREAENRSDLDFDLDKSSIFNYSFDSSTSIDETKYYKLQLNRTLWSFIIKMEFNNLYRCWKKHRKNINILDLSMYILIQLKLKIANIDESKRKSYTSNEKI